MGTTEASYRTHDVPVAGGMLRVGVWEPADATAATPTVLAIHGITASHRCWLAVVDALPGVRVVAADLRGRGRSNGLPGPYGMPAHAVDLVAVLDHLGLSKVVLLGHSMGGFVALVLAHRAPDRVTSIVLVDGGLPLAIPEGLDTDTMLKAVLGPAAERLTMTFPDRATYREFWQQHPALAGDWDERIADYVDYDLTGTEPELHPATAYAAVAEDSAELHGGESLLAAITALQHPTTILRSPRGLMNTDRGLYTLAELEAWDDRLPDLTVRNVEGVNHYTIVMGRGAGAGAEAVRAAL